MDPVLLKKFTLFAVNDCLRQANKLNQFICVLLVTLFTCISGLFAQSDNLNLSLQSAAGFAGADTIPFWMRANRFGDVPVTGAFAGLSGRFEKRIDPGMKLDWGVAVQGRADVGKTTEFKLIEASARARFSVFEILAGRTREISGLCDTLLSSGSFTISGNAPGVPLVQVGVPNYYTLPFLGKMFALKGSMSHGWMGKLPVNPNWRTNDTLTPRVPTYLYQMSLYGRFGKENWKVKIYGGITHDALWGSEDSIFSEDYELSPLASYFYVATGKVYNNKSIQRTRIGNHQGSIDVGLEVNLEKVRFLAYRQSFYDAGALYYLANILDGLNGLSIENKQNSEKKLQWNRLLFEFLYTKNQAGEEWSRYTPSPYEDYYNHVIYRNGWSYQGAGLGTPFITPEKDAVSGLPGAPGNYFINNRVVAFHLGFIGMAYDWQVTGRFSYSRNFGTYQTATSGKSEIGPFPTIYGVFPVTTQFSGMLEANHEFNHGLRVGVSAALDAGELLKDSFGVIVTVGKRIL